MDLKELWFLIRYSIFNPWTKYGLNQCCEMCGKRRFKLKSCGFYWTCPIKKSPKCISAAIEHGERDTLIHRLNAIRDNT